MKPAWIDHPGALTPPAERTAIGLDTEFMRRSSFHPRLALVQVAQGDACWLLDPLAYDAGVDLRAMVDGRACVMHSASEDVEALAPLLGDTPLRLFDTQIAAAMCGMGAGLSYQRLVEMMLGIAIPKGETRSDWLHRPLTASQLDYAGEDVAHLAALHGRLSRELEKRGRTAWHTEDCARLARRQHPVADPQPQCGFPAAAGWSPDAQARLKRVLLWRDATARTLDRPRPWLLDDAHALALSQEPPTSPQALFERVKGQRALRGPQRAELFALLAAAATPEELAVLAPIPAAPRGTARHAVDAMRTVVKALAAELDLPSGLLCPRRLVEQFVVTRVWPENLQGWRAALLEAKLHSLLPA